MALLNRKLVKHEDVFYQKRKKDVIKVFKVFKNQGLISDFCVMKTIKDTYVVSILFHLHNHTNGIIFHLFQSNNTNFLEVGKDTSHQIDIYAGVNKKIRSIAFRLKKFIVKGIFGIQIESKFLEHINGFKKNDLFIEKSNSTHDMKGIDFWVYFLGNKIPLQIKTSHFSVMEHKKRFPLIPTLFYFPNKFSDVELYKILFEICKDYKNGKISHIC